MRLIANAVLLLAVSGCTTFNKPLLGDFLAVVGAQDAPSLAFYKPNRGETSLELYKRFEVTQGYPLLGLSSGLNLLAYYGQRSVGVVSLSGTTLTQSEHTQTGGFSNSGIAVSPDSRFVYYSQNSDEILVRAVSSGVLAASDSSSYTLSSISPGDTISVLDAISPSGALMLGYSAVSDQTVVMTRNITSGAITGDPAFVAGNGVTRAVPALGAAYFFASNTGQSWMLTATTNSLSSVSSLVAGSTVFAIHPTKPWAYISSTTTIRRLVLTATTITSAATTTVSGTAVGLEISPSGERMIRLTSNQLQLYSIASDGSISLLSTSTISNSTLSGLALLKPSRT